MKKIKTITLFCAAILLSGCGSGNKAKNLVSDFLDVNLKNNDISDVEFSALDSTSLVSDSIINVMRKVKRVQERHKVRRQNKRTETVFHQRELQSVQRQEDETHVLYEQQRERRSVRKD